VVLGMGKLGAPELNLSSDIDLIFAYPEPGQTDGIRPQSNEQFFIRLCQRLVNSLDAQQGEGFVFRVDVRLRPFGEAGPLAFSFDAMERYYASQAREWERYAMIKARVVAVIPAAGRHSGEQLMALLRPFVYRRYLDYGVIESLREMKGMISKELHRKGMEANIKLGPGGIREIEFIGQAFQLIRGGRDKALQVRPILAVLDHLAEKDLMPDYAVRELKEAYAFLRLTENRLQAWADKQTHVLPADEEARLRLARSMNFPDWNSYAAHLGKLRNTVQGHFDMVIAAPQAEAEASSHALSLVWHGGSEARVLEELLKETGFADPPEALRYLGLFRQSHTMRELGQKGRIRLDQLMPLLLEAIGQLNGQTQALQRVLTLLESIARRTAYIALLVENPIALSQLVRLCGMSPWIARLLARHPILLDELLDPRRLYSPLQRAELEAELDFQLSNVDEDDLEQQMERLRHFNQSNLLRVAAADITEQIPLMVVSDYLTEVAECVISRVVSLAWQEMVRRHGKPPGQQAGETGLAVIGYGKMGGIELGYGSDLDLVFLYGTEQGNPTTDGEKPIGLDVFYARMVQRIIHLFTTRTPSGILYELDMRLRPNGNSGLLATSLQAFETYQFNHAWTWEHQALIRARMVAGDPGVGERFAAIRRAVLGQPRETEKLRAEVVEMREKMRANLDKSRPGCFDLKQGAGGIVDIEFMVQYQVLLWAGEHPGLLEWTDNIRLMETLAALDLMAGTTAEKLIQAYRSLRAAYHRNALQEESALISDAALTAERHFVAQTWNELMLH